MMRYFYCAAVALLFTGAVNAQTLFTYGNKQVSKAEFLRAFNKNPGTDTDRRRALTEYLDLYVNFKLKVQAAYDAGMQKDATYLYETGNFKKQLSSNVINDESNIGGLTAEAYHRSKKDIHLAQVMVTYSGNDTAAAYKKINEAYAALQQNKAFADVVTRFSNDNGSIKNGGDLGYITAFNLSYDFENQAYALAPGSFSKPFKSSFAYHIFKNINERPAAGTRTVAQILFAFPPDAAVEKKAEVKRLADSVYNLLSTGNAGFDNMVLTYSNDVSTMHNKGLMPEITVGKYSAPFENAAYALKNVGDLSKPFETRYGYHILALHAVNSDIKDPVNDPAYAAELRTKVEKDERLKSAKQQQYKNWLTKSGYKPAAYNSSDLWKFIDSFKTGKAIAVNSLNENSTLYSFTKQKIKASDFGNYVRALNNANQLPRNYSDALQQYVHTTAEEYYGNHIEDFNSNIKNQLTEFNEANLLFAIMDKEVWSKAAADEKQLQQYYNTQKTKYKWEASADAVLITAADAAMADSLQQLIAKNADAWKTFTMHNHEEEGHVHTEEAQPAIITDSARFELNQIPVGGRTNFTAGLTTAPVKNDDGSYTFAYIIKLHPAGAQRSFADSRGLVINDYQQVLENKWIAQLKKKYPVKINQAVFAGIK